MEKVIIYGKGEYYKQHKDQLPTDMEIVAYADSSVEAATSVTGRLYEGKPVLKPSELKDAEFDRVCICTDYVAGNRIFQTLMENYIPSDKVFFLNRFLFQGGWEYEATEDKRGLVSTIGGIKIKEQYLTDFDIVKEIFVDNAYHLEAQFHNCIAIDIGMNIGVASLYFARMPEVRKVYGFEPFPDTYQQALENFARNASGVHDKIVPHNIALLNENKIMQVAVTHEESGWRNIFDQDKGKKQVEIVCRAAGEVVREILEKNPDVNVVLKCDTEGSEFAIFDSLESFCCFERIDVVMMEYHGNSRPLVDMLRKQGYKLFVMGDPGRFGMLYAAK